jgi:septal ring factor EnvC (AmiA/AmiB activator)
MRRVPWTAGIALLFAALVLSAAQPERKPTQAEIKAEADLRELNTRLARVDRQAQKLADEADALSRMLRQADLALTRANRDLSKLGSQRAQRAAARQQLVDERARRQAEREATEADLASQLRAAYFMGRREPLKLLLNQRNPAEFGRNLTYYGYLGRLRATQIKVITTNIARIDELTTQIDDEDGKLADLELQQKQLLEEGKAAAEDQAKALALKREQARDSNAERNRLRAQRRQQEDLIKELRRAAQAAPFDPDSPFGQRKGKLSWPVAGRVVTSYGAKLGPDLLADYIDIDAVRGVDVRAVHEGRVIFADYDRSRGNIVILEHGDYWSVYGNVDQLFKSKLATVAVGERIATVGDTGGRKRPGLYFQLLYRGKPVDPRGWFRTTSPPGS